jgi:Kef-type K+ transport system membrane component KefB
MTLNPFLHLGVIFLAGYLVKIVTRRIGIPEVTGYVILGIVLGVSTLRFLDQASLESFSGVSTIALGIIALIIGMELRLENIRKLGKSIIVIVALESMGAFLLVSFFHALLFPGTALESILLGAVASATAPAATVAVIRQYKARGSLTTTILAVVGMDDAAALIIYVFASSFVKSDLNGEALNVLKLLGTSILSIAVSAAVGAAFSFLYYLFLRRVRQNEWISVLLISCVFLMLGICEQLGVSELLCIMVFGAMVTNASPALGRRSEGIVEGFSPIFLAAFFILGGAHLDFRLFAEIGLGGLVYFLARGSGKFLGAGAGAWIGGAPPVVRRFIGLSLLPQVGVALALALAINKDFNVPKYGVKGAQMAVYIINILLFTTIITEIVGPLLTRFALKKSGEAGARTETVGG